MKDFDHDIQVPEQTEIHAVKPVEKEKTVKKIFRRPGHRIFQLELGTGIISEVVPEKQNATIVPEIDLRTGRVTGVTSQEIGEIKRKEGCLYVTALRVESADKHFHRLLNRPYKKHKK